MWSFVSALVYRCLALAKDILRQLPCWVAAVVLRMHFASGIGKNKHMFSDNIVPGNWNMTSKKSFCPKLFGRRSSEAVRHEIGRTKREDV